MNGKLTTLIAVVVIVVAAAFGVMFWMLSQGRDVDAVHALVVEFGQQLQSVQLQSSSAPGDIASAYAPYVAPALLAQWEADPQSAPGEASASPWPDSISVESITQQGADYLVRGHIILKTNSDVSSGGVVVGEVPVTVQVGKVNGIWMITGFTETATSSQATTTSQ